MAPADGALPASALAVGAPFSVYLHVPFCRVRCGYCDFNTYTPTEVGELAPGTFLHAARAELDLARSILGPRRVETVFFGGGTPTMLPAEDLAGLLAAIGDRFELAPDAEVTTEANPETLTPRYLARLREAIHEISTDRDYIARLEARGADAFVTPVDRLPQFLAAETVRWRRFLREAGMLPSG